MRPDVEQMLIAAERVPGRARLAEERAQNTVEIGKLPVAAEITAQALLDVGRRGGVAESPLLGILVEQVWIDDLGLPVVRP